MPIPDWRSLTLADGVVLEPGIDEQRLVFWRPDGVREGYAFWERISTVARAEVWSDGGVGAVAATAVRARRREQGLVGKLLGWGQSKETATTWLLPSGEAAEQCGPVQTGLLLVWAEAAARPLDETRIRQLWPTATQVQAVATNVCVVRGGGQSVEQPANVLARAEAAEVPLPSAGEPQSVAEQWLATARQQGDRAKEAAALTELGILALRDGDGPRSYGLLTESWAIVGELGDARQASDVRDNLGLAALGVGDVRQATRLFLEELGWARSTGNLFAEKSALGRLGLAAAYERDAERARLFYKQALVLARQVGDQHQEVLLLWDLGIQHAELGQREQAIAHAQAAVDLLLGLGKPEAGWFAEHLKKYRAGESNIWPTADLPTHAAKHDWNPGETRVNTALAASAPPTPEQGPGLLRMALTATEALARFIGSAGRTTPGELFQKRMESCNNCQHHTGVRCRLCGCFTIVKTRLPHERCPIGTW